ncbi:RagB/SusD family nutrient uptake outer membrane protein [Chondrinema litorale]|uniref:RagB/SusD family nutrient uptake outer membrane protein n=1 Tax=Chondrinema litorale TaxID=2994555 RepID=UPI002542C7D7|nr:RagB/SusD family nutrient uptake outer membrane protein [Chondrinema litorale]UZR98474.1 RagB/SusD family nutrient uptake outer membrane protein [Chondrinema litorale]
MKKFKIYNLILTFLLIITVGCEGFLDEESVTDITSDSYYNTEQGYEDLVKSCYAPLRDIILQYDLVIKGTDVVGSTWTQTTVGDNAPFDQYNINLNASTGAIQDFWDILYTQIGRTNTALSRAEDVTFTDSSLKIERIAEAKFLRALSYFYLVQTWGDVPMPLEEVETPDRNIERIPSADIYIQILKDLTEAEADLPATASDYGRATKGAAQFLLSRVYLTRGWNFDNTLGGSNDDFQKALDYADQVIAAYPLEDSYSTLFPTRTTDPLNQYSGSQEAKNSEVVFAIQYEDDILTSVNETTDEPGNHYHSIWPGNGELVGSNGRTSDYNRNLGQNVPQPSLYRLYDPQQDARYQHNFLNVIYALTPVANYEYSYTDPSATINFNVGDTVSYWTPWNQPATGDDKGIDEGGTKNYAVINLEQQISGDPASRLTAGAPSMWKFWEPNIQYGDGYGTFDFALFRSAEAYLLAAEAILKGASGGALGSADQYYNKLIDRAVGVGVDPMCALYPEDISSMELVSYRATPSSISIDLILDERARELMGEFNRWFDLKRTEKLIERVEKMNLWAANKGSLDEHHLLRPIPQSELDRSSTILDQNPGY